MTSKPGDHSRKTVFGTTGLVELDPPLNRSQECCQGYCGHFQARQEVFAGKGMIVAMLRRIAAELYDEIIKLMPEWHSDELNKGAIKVLTAAEVMDELINISKEIVKSDKQAEELGLSNFEYAFYTAVANNESARELMQQDKLRELASVLFEKVKANASINWTIKESVKAKLKVIVKRTLRQYDYPPDMQKLATETVLKQAEMLGRNSKNSSLPPSSDGPGGASTKPRKKSKKGRKRGGQKGHKGFHRALLPPELVDEVVDMYPARCEHCAQWLPKTPDARPHRHQHTELSPFAPHVTEYRRHQVRCGACGHRTRAIYDDDIIPQSAFGPRLKSVVVLLTGVYHLSRRATVRLLRELLGLRISTGSVSNIEQQMSDAVKPAFDEAWEQARAAPVKHTDGTSWLQTGVLLALWTLATVGATVFKILPNGQRATLRSEILPDPSGVLVSDRATALEFWAMKLRQICWAHLLRKFISFTQRDGPARTLGQELLDCTAVIFAYWGDFKEERLTREQLIARMAPVRADFERTLRRAIEADIEGLSGSCSNMWKHREALWTFVDTEGVEPTNNHAERELRAFVLWRRRGFGSRSERGDRFAERLMTIAHTARKQGRDILAFLVACATRTEDEPVPSLFAEAA